MELKDKFDNAVVRSRDLPQKPDNEELLILYALYKQAVEGDVSGERPGGFDFKGAAKFDAWKSMEGKMADACMEEYIGFVDTLYAKYGG